MIILSVLLLLLSLFSIVYSFLIISYSGIATNFLWIWFAISIISLLASISLFYIYKKSITLNKILKIILISFFLLGISIFIYVEALIISNANKKPNENAKYVIILGAQVRGKNLSRALKSRLDVGYLYIKDNTNSIIIVTGGQGAGEEISEALAMKNYLLSLGISESRIITEDKSTSTKENIVFSKELIKEEGEILIVTNDFHTFRAKKLAKKQGLTNVITLGAPSDDILKLHYYVREFFAIIKEVICGNII